MNWIRFHYDRVLALAAVSFLFSSLGLIGWRVSQFQKSFPSLPIPSPPIAARPLAQLLEMELAGAQLRQPSQWTFSGRSGLFVPEKHFIDGNGFPATLKTTELHPPVPNEWLEEHSLPITVGDVLSQDPDGDGFSNLEEWQNHTRPRDKDSHPAFIAKLKMKSFVQEPFRLVFASWVDQTFAINTNDLREPTQFLKIGDPIRGTKFKLVKFTEKHEPNRYGTRIDVSELTLENQETGEHLNLVKERIMISPESVAKFVYTWGGDREFSVKKDQEFSLRPEEGIKYKLVDVQSSKAIIVNIRKPDEPIDVAVVTP